MRIALNAGGLGGMPVSSFQSDAANLTNKIDAMIVGFVSIKHLTCNLNGGVGALQGALDSVQSRVNTEEAKREAAIAARVQVNSFLALAKQIDNQVADVVQQNKEEFYSVNPWLKPSSEKSFWEKLGDGWNNFWSGVGDFLKNAWDGLMEWVKGVGEFFSKTVWEKWLVKGVWETFCKEWVWETFCKEWVWETFCKKWIWETFCKEWVWETFCKEWVWETFCKDWIADKAWNWIKQAAIDVWEWLKNPEVNLGVKILGVILLTVGACLTGLAAIILAIVGGIIEIIMLIRDYFTDKEKGS